MSIPSKYGTHGYLLSLKLILLYLEREHMRQFKLMQTNLTAREPGECLLAALVNIRGHQLVLQEWKTQLVEPVRL